jgi:hypothetical protein
MAMAPIHTYELRYDTTGKTAVIVIKYGEPLLTQRIPASSGDAIFLADLLRYEKPVFFDPNTGWTTTGDEHPGRSP